ncbi:MAG: heavy-metal-associated domain-containing protein [Rhodobacteraceae bacterium]|nr:heavy-metal-associated domain-containing protein [Paracoccaceae bacterium]
MKPMQTLFAAAALVAFAGAVQAEPRQVTISADLTCPVSDPQLFEIVLKRQPGVISVDVSFKEQKVVVIYDADITNPRTLADALIEIGLGDMLSDNPMIEEAAPVPKP